MYVTCLQAPWFRISVVLYRHFFFFFSVLKWNSALPKVLILFHHFRVFFMFLKSGFLLSSVKVDATLYGTTK